MTSWVEILLASAFVIVATMPVITAKMHIWVYEGLYLSADRWSMKFSTTQKCYTFASCFDSDAETVAAEWEGISDALAIVFYDKEQCQGTKLISHNIPKGQVMFTFDKGAKSFMVWNQGMYATNGIEHECEERATLNANNVTNSSGSLDVGDEIIVS